MIGEIIAIGDELTSGRILNLTSNFAAYHLFAMGHEIVAMATIGDSPEFIGQALKKALARADFIIVTGGLGPTTDDLTTAAVAKVLERPVTFHPEIQAQIKHYLASHPKPDGITAGIDLNKLAWLPRGAEVLKPAGNMAGYVLIHTEKPIFFLPGVPQEMQELLKDCVLPRLRRWPGRAHRQVKQRLYRIFGLPETEVNQRVRHLEGDNSLVRLGYYPVFPEVHLSLTALGATDEESSSLFQIFDRRIKEALGDYIYGFGDETMAVKVGELAIQKKVKLAIAESCTGGLISHTITTVPGSSNYFLGGIVSYSNQLKMDALGVEPETLARYGAVSAETAMAMAHGIKKISGADITVAATGVAGPAGGSGEKPVGTVYFGLATPDNCRHYLHHFSGSRTMIQAIASQTALDILRKNLMEFQ
ncbi:MAG: CinA family nicotinamide mononucleotide deamidase-related protein [Deltaproteobacteria bacterium]|nr:CinA family nicotinamide mononucleotide deamidase-related protein [Deltaproteobacteria bacterium]